MKAELALRAVAFSMLCGLVGYIIFVLTMYVISIIQIAVTVFSVMGGPPSG